MIRAAHIGARAMKPCHIFVLVAAALVSVFGLACSDASPKNKDASEKKEHLVEVAAASREDSEVSRVRTGTLMASRAVKIHAQEEGRIEALPFHEGDRVKRGDVLLRLDSKILQSQTDRARALLSQATHDLRQVEALHEQQVVAENALQKSRTAYDVAKADVALLETRLGYTEVRSPMDGVVSERRSEPGNVASRLDHVLTVIDTSSLVTEVSISGLVLPLVEVGDPVDVRIDALGESVLEGSVGRIHPTLDATTQRGVVEVLLEQVPADAKPGQLCRVEIRTHAGSRVMIPFSALRRDESGEHVYVVAEGDKVRRAPVRSGLHVGENVEVMEGLAEGDRVVTRGFLGLTAGKKVKLVATGS